MELNWIDIVILSVVGLGLLFGLMWGLLRMVFFGFSLAMAIVLIPTILPLVAGPLDQFVYSFLGSSNSLDGVKQVLNICIAIFVPFLIISIVLAWPYSLLARFFNPFVNFGVGGIIGAGIGFALACLMGIMYALLSEGQPKRPALCQSSFAPWVYAGSQPIMDIALGWVGNDPEQRAYLESLSRAVREANPSSPQTCGDFTV